MCNLKYAGGCYNEDVPFFLFIRYFSMSNKHQYWPWDDDPDGAIYENLAWDLPGFRPARRATGKARGTGKNRTMPAVRRRVSGN